MEQRKRMRDEVAELQCPLCCDVYVDAVQTRCCGANTCRACLMALTAAGPCPFCRDAAFDPLACVPDVKLERHAASAQLPCPNSAKGCAFVGDRHGRAAHVQERCVHVDRQGELTAMRARIEMLEAMLRTVEETTVPDLRREVALLQQHLDHAAPAAAKVAALEEQKSRLERENREMRLRAKSRQASAQALQRCVKAFADADVPTLRILHNVRVVVPLVVRHEHTFAGLYEIRWRAVKEYGDEEVFDAQLKVENLNVSFYVRCTSTTRPVQSCAVMILHPTEPSKSLRCPQVLCEAGEYVGRHSLMAAGALKPFVLSNRLILGV